MSGPVNPNQPNDDYGRGVPNSGGTPDLNKNPDPYPAAPPPSGAGSYPPPPNAGQPGYPQQDFNAPAYNQGGFNQPPAQPKNGLGIAALVLGILSILAFWTFGFGILLGLIAVVLGFIARKRVKSGQATNGGMALTGLILGAVGIIIGVVAIALSVWVFNEAGGNDLRDCLQDAGSDSAQQDQCQRDFEGNLEDRFGQ